MEKDRPLIGCRQSAISPVALRCSQVAFYRERGDTYKAIAKRYDLSAARIQQLVKKHRRVMLATALLSVGARSKYNWDKWAPGYESSNVEETNAILCLLKQMAEGAPK